MSKYMLLLHESPHSFDGLGPEEIQRVLRKYFDWRDRLEREGRYLSGEKLKLEGRAVRKDRGEVTVTDGPFGEAREVLGGFCIVEADTYEHALGFARDSPHLDRGGWIEVRPIDLA